MPRVKQIAVFVLLVGSAVALAACNRASGGGAGKDTAVAAVVNGKNIYLREVDAVLNQQAKGQQSDISHMSQMELAAGRLQVLDDLIRQEILYQRAEKEGLLPKDEEVTQVIEEQKQQSGMTAEQYQEQLRQLGQTEQELREIARKQLAIKNLLDRTGSKVGTPSEKEVTDFFNSNRERYITARGVGLAAIIVDPNDNGATNDAKGDTEAKNKIDIIYQRLKSGADFATVAREQSEDPQSVRGGGDIGFYTEDDLKKAGFPADLIAKFFGPMQTGDITAPVKGSDGRYEIFKLTAKRLQTENLTLDNPDVRKDITDTINNQRKQLMNAALLEVAMSEAHIENKLAQDTMNNAAALSSLRPAGAATPAPTPAASASPAAASPSATAAPAASVSASPAAARTPAAARPTVAATPRPAATPAAKPANTPAPKPPASGNSNH